MDKILDCSSDGLDLYSLGTDRKLKNKEQNLHFLAWSRTAPDRVMCVLYANTAEPLAIVVLLFVDESH